jgi:hypothetical protein
MLLSMKKNKSKKWFILFLTIINTN